MASKTHKRAAKSEVVVAKAPVARLLGGTMSMKDKLLTFLVIVLVVASFVVGYLFGKVSVYEKLGSAGLGGGAQQAAPAGDSGGAEPEVQLTDEQWKKVVDGAVAVKGSKDAKVIIAEFTDYQCPFCEQYYTSTESQIVKDYVDTGKVQYVIHDYPLSFHPNAKPGSLAARCAGEQGKYWDMHAQLFGNQDDWVEAADVKAKFVEYAGTLGLNISTFTNCYTSGKYNSQIDADVTFGSSVSVSGTPTFFINGKQLVGAQPYSAFQAVIDEALAKAQ